MQVPERFCIHPQIGQLAVLAGRMCTPGFRHSSSETSPERGETLLAAAWRRWGPATPGQLEGPFAFAVSDPARQAVYLARDPLGEAPCYYALVGEDVLVSADMDALLAEPSVSPEVDLEAVALRLAGCHGELLRRTDYGAIKKVAPGTVLRLDRTSTRETRYWHPEDVAPARGLSFYEAVEMGDALVRRAVDLRLPTGPVAAHMSGGLDSDTVAAVGAKALSRDGRSLVGAYSWSPAPEATGFGWCAADERRRVQVAAAGIGVGVRFSDPDRVKSRLARGVDLLADPPMAWAVEADHAADAAARGVSAILTGWGGDEGISHHTATVPGELMRRGRPMRAWDATVPFGQPRSRASRLRTLAAVTVRPGRDPLSASAYQQAVDAAWRRYSPDIADARLDQVRRWAGGSTTRARLLARITHGHLTLRNESWARGGAPLGLTYLTPLQDRRVLEFAISLPPEFFTAREGTRRIFRAIAARHLPPERVHTPKNRESEPAFRQLSAQLAVLHRKAGYDSGRRLGWPEEMLDAWASRFVQLHR